MTNILETVTPTNKPDAASLAADLIVANEIMLGHKADKDAASLQVSKRLLTMHAQVLAVRYLYEDSEWTETVAPALHGHLETAGMKHHSRKRLINWSSKAYEMSAGLRNACATDKGAVESIMLWFESQTPAIKTQQDIYKLGFGADEKTKVDKVVEGYFKLSKEEQEEAKAAIAEVEAELERIEAEKANAKALAMAARDDGGETVDVEDGTNVPVHPGMQWVAGIRAHAVENYSMKTVAWDHVVEAWEDEEIAEAVASCTTLKGAIKKIGLTLKTIREAETEARNA